MHGKHSLVVCLSPVAIKSVLHFAYPSEFSVTITSSDTCVSDSRVMLPKSIVLSVGVWSDKFISFVLYPRKLICNLALLGILLNLKVPSGRLFVPVVVSGIDMAALPRGVAGSPAYSGARMVPMTVTVDGASAMDGVGTNGATIKINPNINVNARFMLCRFGCNVIGNVYR